MIMKNAPAIERVNCAIEAIKQGGVVLMTDDESRENEGDLVFAAVDVSAEKINFMINKARGLVCLALDPEIVKQLGLPMMSDPGKGTTALQTAFTVSIEASKGVTTGISAADRARTVAVAIDPNSRPVDLVVPGHIFPLRARVGGVLERVGHSEGSVDLIRMAGKRPGAVICEMINDDGTMARAEDHQRFAKEHGIPILSIADIVEYRSQSESFVQLIREEHIPTDCGTFLGKWFENTIDGSQHLALVKGEEFGDQVVETRVLRHNPLWDCFHANYKPTRIDYGLRLLQKSDAAVLLNLCMVPGKSFMPDGDPQVFGTGAQILQSLGVRKMRLHGRANQPRSGLSGFGLEITDFTMIE